MAMSDIATWGSTAPSVITDTDVPSSTESLSYHDSDLQTEDELDFDDDFVVHGGAGPEVVTAEPEEQVEVVASPGIGESEDCEADAELEEVEHPRRRKSRKKRWLKNILKSSSFDWAVAAAVGYGPPEECETTVQDSPHADLIDLNAMQQIIKEEGKVIVPAGTVRTALVQN